MEPSRITELSKEQKERRVLAVIYRLSGGVVGKQVKTTDLLNEINRLGIMYMDETEFEAFRVAEITRAHAARN